MKPFEISAFVAMLLGVSAPADPPPPTPPAETRLFELREYHATPGRLAALHERFRTHTLALMEKHGITHVAYFVAADGRDDTLRVLLAYPDAAARKRAWESFVVDPEWQRVKRESETHGRLVEKIREYQLVPTADCPRVTTAPAAEGWLYELQMSAADAARPSGNPTSASVKVLGSWTTTNPLPPNEASLIRLVARRPVTTASTPREAFFRGPVEPNPTVRPTAGEASVQAEASYKSLTVAPTDYSPIK